MERYAISRTGLPTVGDTLLGEDGLEASLVSAQRLEHLMQARGSAFRPKNGLFLVVTIAFNNTNDSGNIVVSKANIVLIEPDGNEIAVDTAGLNALLAMPYEGRGRPPAALGRGQFQAACTATLAVVFDVDPGWQLTCSIDIEGFLFEVPNP